MSLHFILDGYNILKAAFPEESLTLRAERNRLLNFIESYSPQGSSKNKVTIVFDGRQDVYAEAQESPIRVIFSRGEDADSCIRSMVEKSTNPKSVVVVSNDNELRFLVRRCGAKIMSVQDFLLKAKVNQPNGLEGGKELPFYLSEQINSELKRIWLKEKG